MKPLWIYCYSLFTGSAGTGWFPGGSEDREDSDDLIFQLTGLSKKEVCEMSELQAFWQDESGVTVVEIILVLLVLIALVLLFKKQLVSLVGDILAKVTSQSNSV